jgi:hypothetical protein
MTPLLAIAVVDIVLLVVLAIVVALATFGFIANRRRAHADDHRLLAQLKSAEGALAQARATDKGWDRELMEAAARDVVAERFGSAAGIEALQLVQVVDHPGTDADVAVFRVVTSDGDEHHITLGRRAGVWGGA